jgi:hypothetical protein
MQKELVQRICLECGYQLKGRKDKKFCSDHCRSTYNNRINSHVDNNIRNINNVLRKNWRILKELNQNGKALLSMERLTIKGFNFTYFTSIGLTKSGTIYYCYDQGYRIMGNNKCMLTDRSN